MRRSNAQMRAGAKLQPFVRTKEIQETEWELFSPFPAGYFFLSTIGMTALILGVAVPLFLLLPRITTGFSQRPSGSTQIISGFSDRVELGQIGTIQQSGAVVMRIQTGTPPSEMPSDLKWRGLAFDHFDGRSWKNTDPRRFPVPTQGRFYKLENSAQGTKWLNQTYFVEALSSNVIFVANKALAISIDAGRVRRDSAGNLYTDAHIRKKLRYAAISDTIRPDAGNISDYADAPREILAKYLQVPEEDPRVLDLARRVTSKAPDRFSKALALERYLRSHYRYSLLLRGTPNSKDPLAAFLFDIRAGHCEYFASSMTIMLRQIGIPARLVNGFRMGEYNGIGDNWTVRQYHAHSWVEAYFSPYGWVEFDPTPADPRRPETGFVRLISDLTDAVDLWWWEGVVNYDSSKQYRVLSALQAAIESYRGGIESFFSRLREKGRSYVDAARTGNGLAAFGRGWILCAALIPLVALLLVRRWRRRIFIQIHRVWHRDDTRTVAASFFAEALDLLGSRGLKIDRGQTALEFARSFQGKPPCDPLMALAHMYYSVRFGAPGKAFDRAEAQLQIRLLRESLRKR